MDIRPSWIPELLHGGHLLCRVTRTILNEKYTLLETLIFEDCAWKCDPFHIFHLLPQTWQLKMVQISSGGQRPQISLIGLKLKCWQHCFFLEAPWEILSLSLQASRGHLHCLARGPFLCPQSQPCSIFRSLSPSSFLTSASIITPKCQNCFGGFITILGRSYMTFTFFFTLI